MQRKSVEYRLKYEYITGQKLPDGFNIHHIDGNRINDVITNLVALPKPLHSKYHNLLKNPKCGMEFINICVDIKGWIGFRDYLRGVNFKFEAKYNY